MFPDKHVEGVFCQVVHSTWYILPLRLRGWGWGTLTGILHKLNKIFRHPTPSILEVLLAVVKVAEGRVTERQGHKSDFEKQQQGVNQQNKTTGSRKI